MQPAFSQHAASNQQPCMLQLRMRLARVQASVAHAPKGSLALSMEYSTREWALKPLSARGRQSRCSCTHMQNNNGVFLRLWA